MGKNTSDNMNRPLWVVKYILVALYHIVLDSLEINSGDFRLWSFLVLTPIAKYFFMFKGKDGGLRWRKKKEFACSVFGDTVHAFILHKVILVYCRGNLFFLFPFIQALPLLAIELLTHYVLDHKSDSTTVDSDSEANPKFTVKMSKNPLDYFLMVVTSLSNHWVGMTIVEFGLPITGYNLLAIAVAVVAGDITFGVFHYLSHNIVSLWKLHQTHHQYKKEELNTLANFYSEFIDGVMMNTAILAVGLTMRVFGGSFSHEIVAIEYFFPALYSHSKYPTTFSTSIWFYELDLFDLVLGSQRPSEFHHHHHNDSNVNFSVYGIVSDNVIKTLVDPFFVGRKRTIKTLVHLKKEIFSYFSTYITRSCPYQLFNTVPYIAIIGVIIITLIARISPIGFVVFLLTSVLGTGFSVPQSHISTNILTSRKTPPSNHNPNATKIPVPLVSTREGNNFHYTTQLFPRSITVMLMVNRFKMTDLFMTIGVWIFVWYCAEPLDTSSAKLTLDIVIGNFTTYIWLNTVHWLKSVRPLPGKTHADARRRGKNTQFLIDSFKTHVTPNGRSWVPVPPFGDEDIVCERGLTTVGIEYTTYLFDLLTWAVEYKFQAMYRIVAFDMGFRPGPELTSHYIYKALINTCFACWFDSSTSQIVFYDTLLPYNSLDLKLWAKISIDIDVVNQTVVQLTMEPYNNGGASVDVVTTTNLPEICAVIHILWCIKTHPNIHFWANAVQEITEEEWKLSTTSHNTTQGFNNGAIFSTPESMGHSTSPQWFGVAISHAIRNGLPLHNNIKVIADQSVAHKMVVDARKKLAEIRPNMHRMKRESIIQATIMHAMDHHYMPKFLPTCANSEILNSSTQLVMGALSQPFEYHCRPSLMIKNHIETDDICAALYYSCASHDQQFADKCLTVGILV